MKYAVILAESDRGFAVPVSGLPRCHSQGETRRRTRGVVSPTVSASTSAAAIALPRSSGVKHAVVEV